MCKTKSSIKFLLSSVLVLGFFSIATPTYATNCSSATVTGTVVTGTPPTHARFAYSTNYSTVAGSQGITTPVQYFYSEGTYPIQQFISGLSANTTYYYRLEVTNNYGTNNLNINNFTTSSCNNPTPPPPPTPPSPRYPTVRINADDYFIDYGESTTVRWSSNYATSCSASGGANNWPGFKSLSGSSHTGPLFGSRTFYITCTNSTGSVTDSANINVSSQPTPPPPPPSPTPPPPPPPTPPPPSPQPQYPTVNITANDFFVDYGESAVVTWNSSNATSCNASGGTNNWSGSKSLSGSSNTGSLFGSATFYITCTNSVGSATDSVNINVGSQSSGRRPNVDLRADDYSIDYNDSTTIRWDSDDADYCSASGGDNGWSGSRGRSGTFYTQALDRDTTYYITCHNDSGSDSDSITIRVYDDYDNDYDDRRTPRVDLRADDYYIDYGENTNIRWDSDDADYCRASGGTNGWSGNRSRSGTFYTGSITQDTTYTMNCYNSRSSRSDSVTIRVNGSQFSESLTVVTLQAGGITSSSARLNSQIFNSSNRQTDTWFEWGTTISLGNRTNTSSTGSSLNAVNSSVISGLLPSTTYYFRAVANSSLGTSYGSILSFRTGNRVVVAPAPSPTPPPPSSRTLTALLSMSSDIDSNRPIQAVLDNTRPLPGDEINYTLNYRNTGTGSARNIVLNVALPPETFYISSDPGNPVISGNVLSFDLGTLGAGEQGSVNIRVLVDENVREGTNLNFHATLSYIDPQGQSRSVSDSITATVRDTSLLGGSIFGAGLFTGGILGWILLIILILIAIILSKNTYDKFAPKKVEDDETIKKL